MDLSLSLSFSVPGEALVLVAVYAALAVVALARLRRNDADGKPTTFPIIGPPGSIEYEIKVLLASMLWILYFPVAMIILRYRRTRRN